MNKSVYTLTCSIRSVADVKYSINSECLATSPASAETLSEYNLQNDIIIVFELKELSVLLLFSSNGVFSLGI